MPDENLQVHNLSSNDNLFGERARPFTPESLSERWECSAEKVRHMFHSGELAGFRLGKLIRIPAIEVERFECALLHPVQDTNLSNTEENSLLQSDGVRIAAEFRPARLTLASPV
jgi:excisionase family DNA binding protein